MSAILAKHKSTDKKYDKSDHKKGEKDNDKDDSKGGRQNALLSFIASKKKSAK